MDFTEENIRLIFGHEAAEDEGIERLKTYYVKGDTFEKMSSELPLYILVGHKGTGKSALLSVLKYEEETKGNIVISIQPDDILDIDKKEDDFLRLIRNWEEGLSTIIFQKLIECIAYDGKSKDKKKSKLFNLIKNITGHAISDYRRNKLQVSQKEFAAVVKNNFFEKKSLVVCIDDLDRGWKNTPKDVASISALLNAVRDLSREVENIKFRIALRSDVYYSVRTSDESTDKIEGSVIWNKWSNHEILVMLIKRIEIFLGHPVDDEKLLATSQSELSNYLNCVFEERFKGKGHWENAPIYRVLMSLTRKRPRDLVKLCTMSARNAKRNNKQKISTKELEEAFNEYSQGRLQDTINEYSSEFHSIEDFLLKMKPTVKEMQSQRPCLYSRDELLVKIKNILQMSHYSFSDGKQLVDAISLAAFLYKINFLTARKDYQDHKQRLYYDENKYLLNEFTDFGYMYEIHPAYRWALQPTDIMDLYYQIDLSDE